MFHCCIRNMTDVSMFGCLFVQGLEALDEATCILATLISGCGIKPSVTPEQDEVSQVRLPSLLALMHSNNSVNIQY